MRGAGYDVRVIADEFESWEENPPSLPDFIKRDLRWCQGNLQYLKLLTMPGLKPMGRFQLVNAIMMYLGAPAGFLMLIAGLAMIGRRRAGRISRPTLAFALYFLMLGIGFAPRCSRHARRAAARREPALRRRCDPSARGRLARYAAVLASFWARS